MSYVCTPISINCFTRSRPGYPPLLLFEWQMNTHHHHAPADAVAVLSTLTLCLPCAQASACAPRIAAKHERHSTRPRTHTQITPRRPVQHQSSMRSSHVVTWTSRTGAYFTLPSRRGQGASRAAFRLLGRLRRRPTARAGRSYEWRRVPAAHGLRTARRVAAHSTGARRGKLVAHGSRASRACRR